jgi:transcriptional regulatory protein RtcR
MAKKRKTVVIGLIGSVLDGGRGEKRWQRWRPSVDLCRQDDLGIDRFELLCDPRWAALGRQLAADMQQVSPDTEVRQHEIRFGDAWAFEQVYASLFGWVRSYPFDLEHEEYLVHITTGTHVAQICWFLLTESRHLPGKLLQASPPSTSDRALPGKYAIIDLDLGRYDALARRFEQEQKDRLSLLKAGIDTRNVAFNQLMEKVEIVATRSSEPILLMGPTGAGKSQLARRVYELKRERQRLRGALVEVNCATLRGDAAMSALFGHVKGAYTGATSERPGYLRAADGGVLFLDEIGELGGSQQAMLLRALEDKTFLPLGSDRPVRSDFQLIAGTNRELALGLSEKGFRDDLLARINLWTFVLPGLRERLEDLEPNLDYELEQWERRRGERVTINREARDAFLTFARSADALWLGSFRDFNAAVTRMATLAPGGRIDVAAVREEIERLRSSWRAPGERRAPEAARDPLPGLLTERALAELDAFDRVQLAEVVRTCRASRSLSDAGRKLFAASRAHKENPNDADRLRKYLTRYGLSWDAVSG